MPTTMRLSRSPAGAGPALEVAMGAMGAMVEASACSMTTFLSVGP